MNVIHYIFFLFLLIFLPLARAQSQDTLSTDMTRKVMLKTDSLQASGDTLTRIKHSPTRAALFSAFCPGLGQIYNKRYWKLPIVYAGIGISGYYLNRNQRLYKSYLQGLIKFSNNPNDPSTKAYINQLKYVKNYSDTLRALEFYVDLYRSWRDWSVFALSLIYLLNIVDATVDAYLFYYDISDDLSLRIRPVMINSMFCYGAIGLQLSFNLH